jgi:hypothetical protein
LSLDGPSGGDSSSTTLASVHRSCSRAVTDSDLRQLISVPSRNGRYNVILSNGGSTTSAGLSVLIPPRAPAGFSVATDGTTATFSWQANPEPDVVAYDISSTSGSVGEVDAGAACNGSTCSASRDFGSSVAGEHETFSVHAVRCGSSCSSSSLLSGPASSAAASFPAAPSSDPSPSQGGGGGGHGGSGGNGGSGGSGGSGGGGNGGGALPPVSGGHGGGGLAPLGGGGGLTAGGGGGGGGGRLGAVHAGGDVPTIDLPSSLPGAKFKRLTGGTSKPAVASPNGQGKTSATITTSTSFGWMSLWRALAAAAVLCLLGAHLRAWASQSVVR